eukprot:Pompholyxophrys_punicea_v1_NODE_79_length_3711_cov_11.301422.p1 type:complete len:705 gc:universal NODE_79_length_3711_cov_11.301422:1524-3638(+)
MPSRYRQRSRNLPYLTFGLNLFSDEWGGSKKSKYNKFESIYCTSSFLNRKARNMLRFIWHIGSSNVVTFAALFNLVSRQLFELAKGAFFYVAALNSFAYVEADIFQVTADNPRAQDLCNCAQSSHTFWCRKCLGHKNQILHGGALRDYRVTRLIVERLNTAKEHETLSKEPIDKLTGVKANDVDDLSVHQNFDPHSDIVIEILHTILIGLVKYITKETVSRLNTDQKEKFQALLKSEKFSSFEQRLNGNVCANWKSFQGKDFKLLVQVMPYLLLNCGASEELVDAWIIVSELSKYSYKLDYDSHPNCEPQQDQIRVMIAILLFIFPGLRKKFKLHLLAEHLVSDFLLLGLLVNASSERFEAINKIMRSFYHSSNFLSPGKDISIANARQHAALFLMLGGEWVTASSPCVLKASPLVVELQEHDAFKNLPHIHKETEEEYVPQVLVRERDFHKKFTPLKNLSDDEPLMTLFRQGLAEFFPDFIITDSELRQFRFSVWKKFNAQFSSNVSSGDAIEWTNCSGESKFGEVAKVIQLISTAPINAPICVDWILIFELEDVFEESLPLRDMGTASRRLRLSDPRTIPIKNAVQSIHVVHHCRATTSNCFMDTSFDSRREKKSAKIDILKHNGPEYLLNRMRFQRRLHEPTDWVLLAPDLNFPPALHFLHAKYTTSDLDEQDSRKSHQNRPPGRVKVALSTLSRCQLSKV